MSVAVTTSIISEKDVNALREKSYPWLSGNSEINMPKSKPNKFGSMKIKTKDFKFNRDEANDR